MNKDFANNDERLKEKAEEVVARRGRLGLEGMVGDLSAVRLNCQPKRLEEAVAWFLDTTGFAAGDSFLDRGLATHRLTRLGSADFLFTARHGAGENPFAAFNGFPRSAHLPDTRVECYVYECDDVRAYHRIQREQGVGFLTPEPVRTDTYIYVETEPSPYVGNSIGLVQWLAEPGTWNHPGTREFAPAPAGPARGEKPWLDKVGRLDHSAIRVHARDRDPAILEFMSLTGHRFDFAVYVESLNSITNVARRGPADYAQVFTSGVTPFTTAEASGPTETFMANYGTRTHHLAFDTRDVDEVFAALAADGLGFISDLLGSPQEGLKQAFSEPCPQTLVVNEYIHRFGDFDGFFTRSNVTELTRATGRQ
jgi:hypothetical protein